MVVPIGIKLASLVLLLPQFFCQHFHLFSEFGHGEGVFAIPNVVLMLGEHSLHLRHEFFIDAKVEVMFLYHVSVHGRFYFNI